MKKIQCTIFFLLAGLAAGGHAQFSPIKVENSRHFMSSDQTKRAKSRRAGFYCRVSRKDGPVHSKLMMAIWLGDLEKLARLVTPTMNLNVTFPLDCNDSDNVLRSTPLINAIEAGRANIVEFLLKNGASPVFQPDNGNSPLSIAASKKNLEIVRMLITHGAPVNDPDDICGPICSAADSGSLEIIRELVSDGATVNFKAESGDTPLMIASLHHDLDKVKLLIELGADACAKNSSGETAIDLAETNLNDDPGKQGIISLLQEKCGR